MGSDAQIWWRRSKQAYRLAQMLSPKDAAIVDRYAKECECRGRCLADPVDDRESCEGPLVREEPR